MRVVMAGMKMITAVRQAAPKDVPYIAAMIRQLAHFERLSDICIATDEGYSSTLFKAPPFQGPTVLLLELCSSDSSNAALEGNALDEGAVLEDSSVVDDNAGFKQIMQEVQLGSAMGDADSEFFTSSNHRTIVGFVLFFPNYSTFLAKQGIYIEDLFIREPYRRQGLGTILLRAVAREAAKRDFGRVEWCVLDWNENAIKFYKEMGAAVLPEWRICRLTGDALKAYGGDLL